LLTTACGGQVAEVVPGVVTVLTGGKLIDGNGGPARRDSVLVIRGDRIDRVASEGELQFTAQASIIDVSGSFILPGFIDTHAHIETPEKDWPTSLNTLLRFGITTIRDPAPAARVKSRVRDSIASGQLKGPRMQVSGVIIDGPESIHVEYSRATTEEEIRSVVRAHAAEGVDMVKIYMYIPPALATAAIDEAHLLGLDAVGHLKWTSWTEAAEAGIDTLVHSGPEGPTYELLGPGQRNVFLDGDWPHAFRQWAIRGLDLDLNGPAFDRLVNALVAHRVEVNPTLVLVEAICWGDDPAHLARLEPEIASAATRAYWGKGWKQRNPFVVAQGLESEVLARARRAFGKTLEMIGEFHRRGVLLTAGSDLSMPWIVPGASYHRELELLAEAGIEASDVLTIATRNGAEAMGLLDTTGTLEEGKIADIVVVAADPTQDVRNTRRIEFVFLAGELVSGDPTARRPG
jgi:imidazolonepropionase-like amidohydrolase